MEALFGVLLESSVRALIVTVAVAGSLLALKVRSPRILHRAWTAVLISMLLLPLVSLSTPKINLKVLPPLRSVPQTIPKPPNGMLPVPGMNAATPQPPLASSAGKQTEYRPSPYEIAFGIYAAVLCAFLARLLVGMVLAIRLLRCATGTGRVLQSAQCRVPLTVGLFRPRILLPLGSGNWSRLKLAAVLDHEHEHLRRRDPLTEWIATLNRCIYWFHPLAWWLCRKLAALAEQACDEAVLARGHEPASYAELLVDLARSANRSGILVTVRGSAIDGGTLAVRIRRILALRGSAEMSRVRATVLVGICSAAILVPSFVSLARAQAPRLNLQPAPGQLPHDVPSIAAASGSSTVTSSGTPQRNSAGEVSLLQENSGQGAGAAQDPNQGAKRQAVAQDAQKKIIDILMRDISSPDRERKNAEAAEAAEAEIQRFLKNFPNSDYAPLAREYLQGVHDAVHDALAAQAPPAYYRKWLEEDVVYIISKEEREAFLALATNEEREQFIEQFWARRNPTPNSADNPMKTEHYRRLAYANAKFACGIPGWRTDRGRIYVLYGDPDGKESHPSGGNYRREFWQGGGDQTIYPFERWRYSHIDGVGDNVTIEFTDSKLDGCFVLALGNERLQAGSLILAKSVWSVPPVDLLSQQFASGLKMQPNDPPVYANGQYLIPYLEIYNAAKDPNTGKPNLQVSYRVGPLDKPVAGDQNFAEGLTQLPFSDRIVVVGAIPIRNFAIGNYHLDIMIIDRISNTTLNLNTGFTVTR